MAKGMDNFHRFSQGGIHDAIHNAPEARLSNFIKWLESEIAWAEKLVEDHQDEQPNTGQLLRVGRKIMLEEVLEKAREFNMEQV
jgi:hypothetical protein